MRTALCIALAISLFSACQAPSERGKRQDDSDRPRGPVDSGSPPSSTAPLVLPEVVDLALTSGAQNGGLETLHRGRACVAADFDVDGWVDLYVGNPGDATYVLRNQGLEGQEVQFEQPPLGLFTGELAWAGSSADYDNDGDPDLYISMGGNEGNALDRLYQNQTMEAGSLDLLDVTDVAGIAGKWDDTLGAPVPMPSANGVWADYDQDSDLDLFVSNNHDSSGSLDTARNFLWRNEGDGTFTDATSDAGLDVSDAPTRHSTWLDIDNDGDLDLYENNFLGPNVLWRNQLAELGDPIFVVINEELAALGDDVGAAFYSYASAAADMNNDGWEDLVVFTRLPSNAEVHEGHHIYLNLGPEQGFLDVGDISGVNVRMLGRHHNPMDGGGVMGCQIGDLNGDGFIDVYVGNGAPNAGETDHLFAFRGFEPFDFTGIGTVQVPMYDDWTDLIDFPAPERTDGSISYPPYPYRTHGTCMADFDRDGQLELFVANGGPAEAPPSFKEPDRLFDFRFPADREPRSLVVRPYGDGVSVPRDPIGTRIVVRVRDNVGTIREVHRTLYAGSAFSGQNGLELYFGLGDADEIVSCNITWPDGTEQELANPQLDARIVVTQQD